MEQVYRVFPGELRAQLERLPPKMWAELEQVIRLASRCSIHAVLPQLRQGFLTLHRPSVWAFVEGRCCGRGKSTPLSRCHP